LVFNSAGVFPTFPLLTFVIPPSSIDFIFLPFAFYFPGRIFLSNAGNMVITRANPTPDMIADSDAQGNAVDPIASGPAPPVDLSKRVEQLSSLMEQLLARDVNRNRQDDQVTQTATSLTQMAESFAHQAQVATKGVKQITKEMRMTVQTIWTIRRFPFLR
jgi:hypothetical protein